MLPDQQNEHMAKEIAQAGVQQIPLLPFAVQLQNIFPVEITAKRFPVDVAVALLNAHTQMNLSELSINSDALVAQIHLEVRVSFPNEPQLFEIYFKMVGFFNYAKEYSVEMVQYFLEQSSLSVMLPSARELLLSLCTRLQVPMVVLPLVQLSPPPSYNNAEGDGLPQ